MGTIRDSNDQASHCAEILKALAHPLRLRIVAILDQGAEHVNALAERLEVKQSVVSQQLRILRMKGLVRVERVNGFARYSLAEPRLHQLVACIEKCSAKL
jgi:ArsR family transcriptional regulator